ncbi:hypothetical protein GCG54_00004169 [Colletotrichum gloeosporioides]|uniref:Uncharacterized protein n=1 Tax=Colletotrichum gloeosporioides TaxID=474922 RepID=A0A8H4CJE5_COLGL|nr:uncharacterized protein GCG54_00004169 [Colletotrichum gloeosporioides]KAF3804899.1 hypothetical protein GCG54_00004169 [Colletotrichum gloeosporioides]
MRNENLYLVVYRPRRNEQYSLYVEGLPKAYFEAWVSLRTFRTTLSVGLAPSLGDHFKSYYGTLVTELVRVGLKLEGEIVAEVHEAAEKNENKRQLKTGLSIALCKKNKEKRPLLYEPGLRRTHAEMAELKRHQVKREALAAVPPHLQVADTDSPAYSWEHIDLSEIKALPVLRSIFNDLTLKRPNLKDASIFKARFNSCLQDTFDLLHGAKIYKTGTPYLMYITLKIIWVRETGGNWAAMGWRTPINYLFLLDMRYQTYLEAFHPEDAPERQEAGFFAQDAEPDTAADIAAHEASRADIWDAQGLSRDLLAFGEKPFEVFFFNGNIPQLFAKDALTDTNLYVDPRLAIGRNVRGNNKLYLVVYRSKRNGHSSPNDRALFQAYAEAWGCLRAYRAKIDAGITHSLGGHFRDCYGQRELDATMMEVDDLCESNMKPSIAEPVNTNGKKRQQLHETSDRDDDDMGWTMQVDSEWMGEQRELKKRKGVNGQAHVP